MYLYELIKRLKGYNPNTVVRQGFSNPHSYQGIYEDLAFEPVSNVSIGYLIEVAKSANGMTCFGNSGEEHVMDGFSFVHLAYRGETGELLTEELLYSMLNDTVEKR